MDRVGIDGWVEPHAWSGTADISMRIVLHDNSLPERGGWLNLSEAHERGYPAVGVMLLGHNHLSYGNYDGAAGVHIRRHPEVRRRILLSAGLAAGALPCQAGAMILPLILQAATLGAANHAVDAPIAEPRGKPTMADEFDRIDPAVWRFDTSRNREGWYNNEKQYYAADRPENARIEKGALVIESRRESLRHAPDWGGQGYTSAKLVSRRAYGYGFYEVRAKLPCGRGQWPAIWLLPDSGRWPDAGEIDVMEMVGFEPNVVHATVHSAKFNHVLGTQRGSRKTVATSCTAFHTYQLDWRPDAITIGVDGRAFLRVTNDRPGDHGAWPFDRPYNLILNLAVGGDWGGAKGIDDAAFPQRMTVDYFRYWKR